MSTVTRSLWPTDIRTDDVRTPVEILTEQANLLEKQTNGLLTGEVIEHVLEDRRVIGFEVSAPRLPTTVRLFEVLQSLDLEYPVSIIPPKVDIPNYLMREVYHPSSNELLKAVAGLSSHVLNAPGGWEKNEWVADSPTEFAEKLQRLLSSDGVKAIMFSLLSRAKRGNNSHESDKRAKNAG